MCRSASAPVSGVRHRSLLIRCLLALMLLSIAPTVHAQVGPGIHRVEQILGSQPFDDLRPLDRIVGDADLVGLGEGVHTSGGFYRAKLRMIQYLVEVRGFRAFGIESPWIDAERAATFVRTCQGTPRDASDGLFGVWQSETLRELLSWMCRFNRQHPNDPLIFFGFDSQQNAQDAQRLRAFLGRIGLSESDPRIQEIDRCIGVNERFPTRPVLVADADHQACVANLDRLDAYFDQDRGAIVDSTSARQLAVARIHVLGLRATQGQLYFEARNDSPASTNARDRGMARIVDAQRALVAPGRKTLLWAHNAHIAKGDYRAGVRWMGSWLATRHGRDYRAIAIAAHDSLIDWPGIGCGPQPGPSPNSVEGRLRGFGAPYLLVDLAANDAIGVGERLQFDHFSTMTPSANFDGLFYLDRSPAMRPLAWSSCGSEAVGLGTDPVPGCNLRGGAGDFCSVCGPCAAGEGDCDRDADCAPGLRCAQDRGADFGFGARVDVCVPGGGGGPDGPGGPPPPPGTCDAGLGTGRYCTVCGPCADGQGDCDRDAECGAGLVCVSDIGADFGFAPGVDVCRPSGGQPPGGPPPGTCGEPMGSGRRCTACGPCAAGEGDCDTDTECASGLRCAADVGAEFGFAPRVDVCVPAGGTGGGCTEARGSGRYCSVCGPCSAGEGDCDGDDECASGLRCVLNIGADFGFAPGVDVCQPM